MNIYLIGLPGSGKTTLGKKLSEALPYRFADMDDLIEAREKMSVSDIFKEKGEEYFREIESALLFELSKEDGMIVSTGGGIVLKDENRQILKTGFTIFLNRPPELIISQPDLKLRPLLSPNPEKIFRLYKERLLLYMDSASSILSNEDSFEQIYNSLLEVLSHENLSDKRP